MADELGLVPAQLFVVVLFQGLAVGVGEFLDFSDDGVVLVELGQEVVEVEFLQGGNQ